MAALLLEEAVLDTPVSSLSLFQSKHLCSCAVNWLGELMQLKINEIFFKKKTKLKKQQQPNTKNHQTKQNKKPQNLKPNQRVVSPTHSTIWP